jgi:diguanylate cyclase (GGDEF)-like protein
VQEDPLNDMTAITADNLGRAAIRLPVAILWPAIILAAAWGITEYADKIPEVIRGLLEYLPYAVTLVGVFIGWRFDRSRLVFSLIVVSIGHWMMTGPASSIGPGSSGEIGYMAYALLFPAMLLVLSLLKERGLLTRRGLLRAAAFAGLCIAVLALTAADHWLAKSIASSIQQGAVQLLSAPVIPDFLTPTSSIPEPALIVFVATAAFFIVRLVALGIPPLESGALGGLVAGGMALHFAENIQAVSLFFTAAAISILIAVIQDSYRLAFVDELTGLPGRNALSMETLKLGQRYAIAMLDVDHFKKFNDTYGHDIGDQVLRMVAGQMARVGGGGKPFRYGGEEFTIIFPGKTAEEAIANLDALRQVIKESGFTIRAKDRLQAKASTKRNGKGKRVSVTISIGVSERSEKNPTPEDVTKAADQALYRAKKGGRNRVSK